MKRLGKWISNFLDFNPLAMALAAASGSCMKGMGKLFLSVMRVRMKPGLMSFMSMFFGASAFRLSVKF